jgi:hypothetical protein
MFKECRHIMPSGARCHSPALRDQPCCYFHTNLRRSTAPKGKFEDQSLQLPTLEDSSAVQLALTQVLGALSSSQLDARRAGLLLYGLQIAAKITARPSTRRPTDFVRSVSQEADGALLATQKTGCEPPEDCRTCREITRFTCKDPMRYTIVWDDDEDEEEAEEVE